MLSQRQRRAAVLLVVGGAIAIAVELGELYTITLTPFDTLAHFSAGLAIGTALVLLFQYTDEAHPGAWTVVNTLGLAILWEVIEIALPGFAGLLALGVVDTVVDVLATVAGGVVAVELLSWHRSTGRDVYVIYATRADGLARTDRIRAPSESAAIEAFYADRVAGGSQWTIDEVSRVADRRETAAR